MKISLPSGGALRINRIAVEADLLVSEGFIDPHFFAGDCEQAHVAGTEFLKTLCQCP